MAIDAKMVKELRDKTGYPITAVKKALVETDGDMEQATTLLRQTMGDKGGTKADRTTGEGAVTVIVADDALTLLAIGCEQEPTTNNEHFQGFVEAVAAAAKAGKVTSIDALMEASAGESSVKDMQRDLVGLLGENIQVTGLTRLEKPADGILGCYVHFNKKAGAICALKLDGADASHEALATAANDVCMHAVAARPVALNRDGIPTELVEKEREVYSEEVNQKPEQIREKIMAGKLGKFFRAQCLTEQIFVKDPDGKQIVRDMVANAAKAAGGTAEIIDYARVELGA